MPILETQKTKVALVYNQPQFEIYPQLKKLHDTVNQCILIRDDIQRKIKEGNVKSSEKLQDLVFLEAIIQSYRAYDDLQKLLFKQKKHTLLKEIDEIAGSLQKGEPIQNENNKAQIKKILGSSLKELTLIRYEIAIAGVLLLGVVITGILFATIPSFAQGFGSTFFDTIINFLATEATLAILALITNIHVTIQTYRLRTSLETSASLVKILDTAVNIQFIQPVSNDPITIYETRSFASEKRKVDLITDFFKSQKEKIFQESAEVLQSETPSKV